MRLGGCLLVVAVAVVAYKWLTLFRSPRIFNAAKNVALLNSSAFAAPHIDENGVFSYFAWLPKWSGLQGAQARRLKSTRERAVARFCAMVNGGCLPPFVDLTEAFVRKIVTVPKYKILSCILPKCMSTTVTMIYSYLYNNNSFSSISWPTARKSATHHENDFNSVATMLQHVGVSDAELRAQWKLNVVVRDPLHRFVSAFVDKCVFERQQKTLDPLLYGGGELCYGCESNITCYMLEQYTRAKNYANGAQSFVAYEDQHTFPQSWFCNFKEYLHLYEIYKQTSDHAGHTRFRTVIRRLLTSRGVNADDIRYVERSILNAPDDVGAGPEVHGSVDVARQRRLEIAARVQAQIIDTPLLLRTFLSMFYFDYVVFDYELPKFSVPV